MGLSKLLCHINLTEHSYSSYHKLQEKKSSFSKIVPPLEAIKEKKGIHTVKNSCSQIDNNHY